MQTQDPYGLQWLGNETALPTVQSHGDLAHAIGDSQGDEAAIRDESRREHQLNKLRSKTHDLRDQVARERLELRELRVELQYLSAKIWEMQGHFWRELQSQEGNQSRPIEKLRELRDEIENALDEIGPKQATYDEKEDDLNLLEHQLGKKEIRLYALEFRLEGSSAAAFRDPSNPSSQQSRGTTPRLTEDENSIANRYLSRVGDANIVKERLMELAEERAHYLDLERDRLAMGLELYQPNLDFLARFDDIYAGHLDELREIDEDLQNMEPMTGLISLDDRDTFPHEADSHSPAGSLKAQSDQPEGIIARDTSGRPHSEGDVVHLSVDTLGIRRYIIQWISESWGISLPEEGRPHNVLDNPDLDDRTWLHLVRERRKCGAAGSLPITAGAPFTFSASPTSREIGRQFPVTFNEGRERFAKFFDYPPDADDPRRDTGPHVSRKPHAKADSFDIGFSLTSSFDDEDFSFHDD
jgi:hypothetical protein